MRSTGTSERKRKPTFEEQYRISLSEYMVRGGESGLRQAYELGRGAVEGGKSLIEIASLHHDALLALVTAEKAPGRQTELLRASATFLTEALSPFEMTHRGFQDAVKALRRFNETLEAEIKRIAHAVHDEAGQLLVAVHLALSDLSRELPKPQQGQLEQVKRLLDQVEQQLRRYSHELRPTVLDDLGWIPALRFLANGVSKRAHLPIEVHARVNGRLPPAIETALYRVVQEALTNAAKHAHASRVLIQARRTGRVLRCSIADDGVGFDVSVVESGRSPGGLGLIGMKERLHAVNGTLSIDSAPRRGTKLLIQVPMA